MAVSFTEREIASLRSHVCLRLSTGNDVISIAALPSIIHHLQFPLIYPIPRISSIVSALTSEEVSPRSNPR